jgi:hypothetical protein
MDCCVILMQRHNILYGIGNTRSHNYLITVKARRNTYGSNQFPGSPHGIDYLKITPVGCPTGTSLHGENEAFQSNRNDFSKVSFTLDGI